MSQVTSLSVENSNGLAVRTGFNGLVAAVNSQHSGGTAPTETVPYMMWADTSSTPATLKIRNAANNGWLLVGTIDEAAGQFLLNSQISGRNIIINGAGRVNQRGYATGSATSGPNQFTLDRWFVQVSGQSLSFTGGSNGRVMTAPAGGVAQVIEGANIVGGTYVLNWTGTANATVNGTTRAKGETFTLTSGINAIVRFASGTFTDVQLEKGSVTTPFEWLSISDELARCQRYAIALSGSIELRGVTTSNGPLVVLQNVLWPVTMRAAPVVSYTYVDNENLPPIGQSVAPSASGCAFISITNPVATASASATFSSVIADAEITS